MKDAEKELSDALSQWDIEVPDDPRFHPAVWREIAMREASSPPGRLRELVDGLLRPKLAIPMGAAAVLMTALLASYHGLQSREKTWDSLAQSYSQAIDPITHIESGDAADQSE